MRREEPLVVGRATEGFFALRLWKSVSVREELCREKLSYRVKSRSVG